MTPSFTIVPFGELVAEAFDRAALHSSNPQEVSRLATLEVRSLLANARRSSRASYKASLSAQEAHAAFAPPRRGAS